MKNINQTVKAFFYIIMFCLIIISGVERLVWANATNYPNFLIRQNINFHSEDEAIETLHKSCGEAIELIDHGSYTLARCGLLWPFERVDKLTFNKK